MCACVCVTVTLLGDGHGCGSPDAAVGSCDHEGASSHGHLQVLLHKPLGGRQEGIPATSEYLQDRFQRPHPTVLQCLRLRAQWKPSWDVILYLTSE